MPRTTIGSPAIPERADSMTLDQLTEAAERLRTHFAQGRGTIADMHLLELYEESIDLLTSFFTRHPELVPPPPEPPKRMRQRRERPA